MADFVAGDTNSKLRVPLTRTSDGAALDLTGASGVKVYWRIEGGTLVNKAMTLLEPLTAGIVEYQFGSGELLAGIMTGEVEVTSGGKIVTTVARFTLVIRARV